MRFAACLLITALVGCTTASPFVVVNPEPRNHAWWLRAVFHPIGDRLRGISAQALNPGWCKFTEFDAKLFPTTKELRTGEFAVDSSYATYSTQGAPLIHGQKTSSILGVYETCGGETGTALVVLADSNETQTRLISVLPLASPAHWATLHLISNNRVEVWWCFACDIITTLEWDYQANTFKIRPSSGDA